MALFLPCLVMANAAAERDPLQPPRAVEAVRPSGFNAAAWRLVSTLVSDGRRVAIINDRAVRIGDRVGGARVLAIESGRVRLDYEGRRFTISNPDAGVRKR